MKPEKITCPGCSSTNTIKKGKKKNKLQILQRFFCKDCKKTFTLKQNNSTYPLQKILKAISVYNKGYTIKQTKQIIKTDATLPTISNWLKEYKHICTFHNLRKQAKSLHSPDQIIEQHTFLHNNLPYIFQIHKAKLHLLFHNIRYNNQFINQTKFQKPLTQYLIKIPTKEFPHHIFSSCKTTLSAQHKKEHKATEENNNKEQRASQLKFNTLPFIKEEKTNLANTLTKLALNLTKNNNQRHQVIQDFMLTNDSTTIATEVPVYLTHDDILYFISRGFKLNLQDYKTPITGHIDLLQIRNNLIHILDYKPNANQNPVHQLTIYALALASRTKLAIKDFKCAWFNENHYYEFFPLSAVYKLKEIKQVII